MPKSSFDSISFCYDALARLWFGKHIIDSQTVFLDKIPEGAKVLIIGGGTGEIIEHIGASNTNVNIDYIELSAKMLAKSKLRKVPDNVIIRFIQGDETWIQNENHYDVVITHYFLDLFEQSRLETIIQILSKALKSDGIWLLSDFYIDDHSSRMQKFTVWLMYRFFRFFSNIEGNRLIVPDTLLMKYGIQIMSQQFLYQNLIRSGGWKKA